MPELLYNRLATLLVNKFWTDDKILLQMSRGYANMSSIPEQSDEGGAVVVEVALREYLTKLEATEAEKPLGKRRPVPSIQDLAIVTGVARQTLYNMANHGPAKRRDRPRPDGDHQRPPPWCCHP
jgi:hypothetical protein